MAKLDSIIKLQGTIAGFTFVKSATYGYHVRAKRGTHKKAELNDTCKSEGEKMIGANVPAKVFKDAIDPYRSDLISGSMWPRLVSMFNKLLKEHGVFDFSKVKPFELHETYPFERFLHAVPATKLDKKNGILHVDICYDRHPVFKDVSYIDGYKLSVIALFPHRKRNHASTVLAESGVMRLRGTVSPIGVRFDVPKQAGAWMICLKIDGCEKGQVTNVMATKGMRMVAAGKI